MSKKNGGRPTKEKESLDIQVEGNTISGTPEAITAALDRATQLIKREGEQIQLQRSGIKIVKAKIADGELCELHYLQYYDNAKPDKVMHEGGNLMHPDFMDAFERFKPHLAVIKDMKESMVYDDGEEMFDGDYKLDRFGKLKVTGIVISGEGEQEGFILIGQKLIGKRVNNELTSNWKFNDEIDPYKFIDEFNVCLRSLDNEAEAYLNGKFGKAAQQEIEFKDETPEEIPE